MTLTQRKTSKTMKFSKSLLSGLLLLSCTTADPSVYQIILWCLYAHLLPYPCPFTHSRPTRLCRKTWDTGNKKSPSTSAICIISSNPLSRAATKSGMLFQETHKTLHTYSSKGQLEAFITLHKQKCRDTN